MREPLAQVVGDLPEVPRRLRETARERLAIRRGVPIPLRRLRELRLRAVLRIDQPQLHPAGARLAGVAQLLAEDLVRERVLALRVARGNGLELVAQTAQGAGERGGRLGRQVVELVVEPVIADRRRVERAAEISDAVLVQRGQSRRGEERIPVAIADGSQPLGRVGSGRARRRRMRRAAGGKGHGERDSSQAVPSAAPESTASA